MLTEGRGSVRLENGDRLALNAGDIVMLPHGDTHIVENGPPSEPVDDSQHLIDILSQGLKLWRVGGGGEVTRFVCGYMACDPRLGQVFLSGLPPVFKVSIRQNASGRWLENSIRFSVDQADASSAGAEAVALTRENDGARVAYVREGGRERGDQLGVERVPAVGPRQRDAQELSVALGAERAAGRHGLSPRPAAWR